MKITKSRLQQIIQEELGRVLSEADDKDILVVITKVDSPVTTSPVGRPRGSRRMFWPSDSSPAVFTQDAAEAEVKQYDIDNTVWDIMPVNAVIANMRRSSPSDPRIGLLSMKSEDPIRVADATDLPDDLASDVDLPDDLAATFKQHDEDGTDAKGIGDRLAQIAGILGVSRTHAREDVMYSEDYDAVAAFKPDPKKEITLMSDDEDGTIQRGKFFGEDALKVVVTSPSKNTMIYVAGP